MKRWIKILVAIIITYILIVSGISLYAKLTNDNRSEEVENSTKLESTETGRSASVIANTMAENIDAIGENDYLTDSLQTLEDREFEKEYAKYLASSLADVPARPLDENGRITSLSSDLASSSSSEQGLLTSIGSFFNGIIDRICAFFEDDKPSVASSESVNILAEIDGEIGEMQAHFTLTRENNGVTYIDHLNKPMMLESNGFYIYIGVAPSGFTFHRTIIRYSGEEEIGLKSILIQTSSSARASVVDASESVYQHKITTAANEWVDLPPTQENNSLLNAVVSSDTVKVTFMGANKNVEWALTGNEIVTLKESLHFYNLLKEKEELSK